MSADSVVIPRGRNHKADITALSKIGRPVSDLDQAFDLMYEEAKSWNVPADYAKIIAHKAWKRLRDQRETNEYNKRWKANRAARGLS